MWPWLRQSRALNRTMENTVMNEESAEQTLRTVISWGRYAEAFAYDDNQQAFSLDNPA